MNEKQITGIVLKRLRLQANLSQSQVVAKVGKGRTWISDIEIGNAGISWKDLQTLAELYNVTPDIIMQLEDLERDAMFEVEDEEMDLL